MPLMYFDSKNKPKLRKNRNNYKPILNLYVKFKFKSVNHYNCDAYLVNYQISYK